MERVHRRLNRHLRRLRPFWGAGYSNKSSTNFDLTNQKERFYWLASRLSNSARSRFFSHIADRHDRDGKLLGVNRVLDLSRIRVEKL